MNKYEIVNSIRAKILADDELTADLCTIDSILNPLEQMPETKMFREDLPPEEPDPEEEKWLLLSTAADYGRRANEIKQFVRAEFSAIVDALPLDLVDAYTEIVGSLMQDRPFLIEESVRYPRAGIYKWDLEHTILPFERYKNPDGSWS